MNGVGRHGNRLRRRRTRCGETLSRGAGTCESCRVYVPTENPARAPSPTTVVKCLHFVLKSRGLFLPAHPILDDHLPAIQPTAAHRDNVTSPDFRSDRRSPSISANGIGRISDIYYISIALDWNTKSRTVDDFPSQLLIETTEQVKQSSDSVTFTNRYFTDKNS